jgi:hypothetical protein
VRVGASGGQVGVEVSRGWKFLCHPSGRPRCLTLPSPALALTTFAPLDELGLEVVGQRLEPDYAFLACRVVERDECCRPRGCQGSPRDTVIRRLAHKALGWRPTTLLVTVRRYRCAGCGHVWRQYTSRAAEPRAKLSRRSLRWALEGIVCQHLTVARMTEGLGLSWNTANDAVLDDHGDVLVPAAGCVARRARRPRSR